MRASYRRQSWWTRERVLVGLRRFYREQGCTPTATHEYHLVAGTQLRGHARRYPSFNAVLRYWPTFRQAWEAAGLQCDRTREDWSEIEDWYLREARGLISREEIARDLRRTSNAVHRRLYDLGLESRHAHGWTRSQIARAAGIDDYHIRRAVESGALPCIRGTQSWYMDPGDLVVVPAIRWESVTPDLQEATRHSLLGRLATILSKRARGEERP